MLIPTLAALSAAVLFALATALQHRSAGLISDADISSTGGLGGFVAKTLRHPLWIAGSLADVAGFGLHALALRDGPLTLVQPLLVTGIVFALPLRQFLEHRHPRPDELRWAAVLGVGLVLFLTISTPADGTSQTADPIPTVVCVIAMGVAIIGCAIIAWRHTGNTAAATLGAAAGLAFAATAGLLKEGVDSLNRGFGALFTTWPLYALIVIGALGLLLNQLAFRAGPLRFSLPAITTIDPIASLIIGVAVFDEKFRDGPFYLLGETLGLALVVAGVFALTRSDPDDHPPLAGQDGKGQPSATESLCVIPKPASVTIPTRIPDSSGRRSQYGLS